MRAATVYRALLWCYPAQFRHEYGREMTRAFASQLQDARGDSWRAVAAVWTGVLVDLAPTALREHAHVMRQDLRHAIRILAATPGFTAVAVLSLALGIGANAAIFSLLDSVVLKTLPVRNPHELVMLTDPEESGSMIGSQVGEDRALITYPEFLDLQARTGTSFSGMLASDSSMEEVQARIGRGEPEPVNVRMISASYFSTLGVPMSLGRSIDSPTEPAPGTAPQAVISHAFWQKRFGGNPDAIGRTIAISSGLLTIVGVAPDWFYGETVGERPDVWVPLAMQAMVLPGRDWLHDKPGSVEKVMWLQVFGRLRPGVSRETAKANANLVFQQGLTAYYGKLPDPQMRDRFMKQSLTIRDASTGASWVRGSFAEPLLVLLTAAVLVLLIACSNLGNLLLARATARSREMSVRLALGASRSRVVRQLLTESLCLAAAGGVAGLAAAILMRAALVRLVTDPIELPPALDVRMLAFVVALSLLAGFLLGLLPALRATKTDAASGLRDQGRGTVGSAAWLRVGRLVVVGQLALSLPLLVGAGLLARTLVNLQRVDLGYPHDDLVTVRVDAQAAGYDAARKVSAFENLLTGIRALPSVRLATYSNNGLFGGGDNGDRIIVEGYTPKPEGNRGLPGTAEASGVTGSSYDALGPGYFSTLGVPILLGREIADGDRAESRPVCVINKTFAKDYFDGRNPIGMHVTQTYAEESHTYEIVGVVADSRARRLRGPVEHRFYTPVTHPAAEVNSVSFIVRPRGTAAAAIADVRRLVQQLEPAMPIVLARTVNEGIENRIGQDRLLARLSIAFGVVAALLVAIGLYGVLSYGVTRRTNEIGIRKALGARPATLIAMILRETGWLLVAGLVAGAVVSAASLRLIESRLYGLSAADPATLLVAAVGLSAIAALAAWLPAHRASRVDPLTALRCE
jgi:predicted permease